MNDEILDALLAGFPLPSLAIDRTERIIAANTEALTLINQKARGQNYVTMLRQPALLDAIETTLTDGMARSTQYLSNDGAQDTAFRVSCRAVQGLGRDMAGVVLVSFEDITDKEQAGQMRRDFVANVSHELRTPLHVIIGGASILSKPRGTALDTDEVVGYASDMHESGVLLLQLVDDLIDLSRSETGDLTLYEEWCDLNEIVDKMVALGKDLPDAAGIALAAEHVAKAPRMFADGRRIKQILLNLISNAIKAVTRRENGEVCVSVERYEDGTACLIVQDNGPGMSADELAVAREPFGQPRAAVRSKGAGLGLAIVDRLAKLHGGELIITTAPGEGLRALVHFDATRFNTE